MTVLNELKKQIIEFRDLRDWKKYHNAKDLALSLSLESSEVLELFQWKSSEDVLKNSKEKLADEIADVFNYLILLSEECGIDLLDASYKKLQKNIEKYPVDKIKGDYRKYSEI